jgi:D-serine dehydratase
MKSDV